jgi:hypothetical protein
MIEVRGLQARSSDRPRLYLGELVTLTAGYQLSVCTCRSADVVAVWNEGMEDLLAGGNKAASGVGLQQGPGIEPERRAHTPQAELRQFLAVNHLSAFVRPGLEIRLGKIVVPLAALLHAREPRRA